MVEWKILYRDACDMKQAWDFPLPSPLTKKWEEQRKSLPENVMDRCSLVTQRETIEAVELHAFGDASSCSVCAGIQQTSGASQGIVAMTSRLAKQSLTIPRLESVSGQMAVNLVNNLQTALEEFP